MLSTDYKSPSVVDSEGEGRGSWMARWEGCSRKETRDIREGGQAKEEEVSNVGRIAKATLKRCEQSASTQRTIRDRLIEKRCNA